MNVPTIVSPGLCKRILHLPSVATTAALLSACEPINVTMDARTLAWAALALGVIVILQCLAIGLLLIRHPRLRRHLTRWGLVEPQLAKTRQQLYRQIARHETTEELLRETQDYLQCIINSMPSVLICVTSEGYVTHWNSVAEIMTGLAADEAMGAHFSQVVPELPINMRIIRQVAQTRTPYTRESVQKGTGSEAAYTDIIVCPLIANEISGAVILADDVTARVRLENMMVQNEKMMSLGELAAGLAHEINNPLAGILNNIQNILRRVAEPLPANHQAAAKAGTELEKIEAYLRDRRVIEFAENIRAAGERAAHIIKNMLEFSHNSNSQDHVATDLSALADQTLELAANTFELQTSEGVEQPVIERAYAPNLPLVYCSPTEIQQVLLNLLRNAAQAFRMDDYGPPLDPKIVLRLSREQQRVVIEVQDNGPGMPEAVTKHIFEPFFTTKDIGQGTGLGLSVSYFIITEHHQGSVQVYSHPGQGTNFVIKLPIKPGAIADDNDRQDKSAD